MDQLLDPELTSTTPCKLFDDSFCRVWCHEQAMGNGILDESVSVTNEARPLCNALDVTCKATISMHVAIISMCVAFYY